MTKSIKKIDKFWRKYDSQKLNLSWDPERFVDHYENCCGKIKEHKKRANWLGQKEKVTGTIRFVVISDTHQKEIISNIPNGDVLLHCGDYTMYSRKEEFKKFNSWIGTLPHPVKIVIAGNHEQLLEESRLVSILGVMGATNKEELLKILSNCKYIENESIIVHGYNIYGSPVTPKHLGGFQASRGAEIAESWALIPDNTDILMTHGPPAGVGDFTRRNDHAGCVDLLKVIQTRVKPLYHCFGHIHEGNGVYSDEVTTYINAAICDVTYKAKQSAYVFDLPIKDNKSVDQSVDQLVHQLVNQSVDEEPGPSNRTNPEMNRT